MSLRIRNHGNSMHNHPSSDIRGQPFRHETWVERFRFSRRDHCRLSQHALSIAVLLTSHHQRHFARKSGLPHNLKLCQIRRTAMNIPLPFTINDQNVNRGRHGHRQQTGRDSSIGCGHRTQSPGPLNHRHSRLLCPVHVGSAAKFHRSSHHRSISSRLQHSFEIVFPLRNLPFTLSADTRWQTICRNSNLTIKSPQTLDRNRNLHLTT